jgi:hypothetical protein
VQGGGDAAAFPCLYAIINHCTPKGWSRFPLQLIEANSQSNLPEVDETWCVKQILDILEIQDFQEKHPQELSFSVIYSVERCGRDGCEVLVKCKVIREFTPNSSRAW